MINFDALLFQRIRSSSQRELIERKQLKRVDFCCSVCDLLNSNRKGRVR